MNIYKRFDEEFKRDAVRMLESRVRTADLTYIPTLEEDWL